MPTDDEIAGMAWWNALPEADRRFWLLAAGTATPATAWQHYKQLTADLIRIAPAAV